MGIKKKKKKKQEKAEQPNYFILEEEVNKLREDVIDWTYKMKKIEEFWINELQDLINWGGREIIIKTTLGGTVKGTLTNVSALYVQLNNSIRVFFDDIDEIYLK